MITRGSVRAAVSGPLARFEAAFRVELARAGYTRSSIRGAVAAMAALSRWLEVRSLAPSELTPAVVAGVGVRQIGPVLRFLREIGEVPTADSTIDAEPAAVLLAGFRSWLVAERGLSAETVRCYCNQASTFLASLPEPVDSSVRQLDSGRVTSFMVGYCRDRNRGRPRRWRPRCARCCGICTCAGTRRPGWSARFRAWRAGGWRRCRAGWTRRWWRGCWARVTGRPWSAAATTRF